MDSLGFQFHVILLKRKNYFIRMDCKEIHPVHSKGDQSWVFFGRTDAKAETPILWPPHAKSWPIGKDSDAGRDWEQEEKGMTENEMAGWHHGLDGRESEWTLGVGDGQGGLACCDSWDRKESDTTERLNWLTDWLRLGLYPPCPQLQVGRLLSFWEAPSFYLYNGPDDNPYLTGLSWEVCQSLW